MLLAPNKRGSRKQKTAQSCEEVTRHIFLPQYEHFWRRNDEICNHLLCTGSPPPPPLPRSAPPPLNTSDTDDEEPQWSLSSSNYSDSQFNASDIAAESTNCDDDDYCVPISCDAGAGAGATAAATATSSPTWLRPSLDRAEGIVLFRGQQLCCGKRKYLAPNAELTTAW